MKTRFMKSKPVLFAILALLLMHSCAPAAVLEEDWGNVPHSDQSLLSVMSRQDLLEVTLLTEIDSLLQKRKTEDYRDAEFSYEDENGVIHSFKAKAKPRGRFRRMTCDFPPLKLKFSKQELEAAGLSDMNELKLVTHCLDDKDLSKSLVLREYLAYKLYNELTPNSLRAQLVKITYLDKSNPDYRLTRYGFLIEDKEEFSWRTSGTVSEKMGTQPSELSPAHEKIVSVFQYMIGNSDWNVEVLRNIQILEKEENKLIPVPYDFDFAAIVSAPYARPNTDVGQKRISERVFMGASTSAKELYSTLNYFKTKKEKLLNIVNDFDLMDRESRESIVQYLEIFFEEIETTESAQKALFERENKLQSGTVFQVEKR